MTVLLCDDLGRAGRGPDLRAVEAWLAERAPGVQMRRRAGPCARTERWLDQGLKGSARLVLGVCSLNGDRHELDAQARRLGLDPFAIEVVVLAEATEKAKLLLAAAVAKTQAYQGSRPEHAKPILSWGQEVSRRSLFTLPPVRYEVVPSIQEAACAAGQGCRVCAKVCPHEALSPSDGGRMILNKAQCTGCGACVSACPREAFEFPGASLAQIEAQVGVLLDPALSALNPRGILFACRKSAPVLQGQPRHGFSYPDGWLPVEVPCLGMVGPTWILHCLNQGAAAVGVLPCPREECRFGRREEVESRVDYCRALLGLFGEAPDLVRRLDPADPAGMARALASLPAPGARHEAEQPRAAPRFAPREGAQAVLRLAEGYGASPDRALTHPHSPLGVVELKEGCTGCGACASACPPGALALEREGEEIALAFDARLCIGCGDCVPICPERVVSVEKVTDLRRLIEGKRVLYRDREVRCEKCGAPVAPRAMLERISALLGPDPAVSPITRYCTDCRGMLL
jgi:ferredoxin